MAKFALFATITIVLAVLLLPHADRFLRRLGVESESIVVPLTSPDDPDFNPDERLDLELVTLLPFDAIQAISDPDLIVASEADSTIDPDEQVLGISINGEHRAYSVRQLSRHEIVNDLVGGVPIAATW